MSSFKHPKTGCSRFKWDLCFTGLPLSSQMKRFGGESLYTTYIKHFCSIESILKYIIWGIYSFMLTCKVKQNIPACKILSALHYPKLHMQFLVYFPIYVNYLSVLYIMGKFVRLLLYVLTL